MIYELTRILFVDILCTLAFFIFKKTKILKAENHTTYKNGYEYTKRRLTTKSLLIL